MTQSNTATTTRGTDTQPQRLIVNIYDGAATSTSDMTVDFDQPLHAMSSDFAVYANEKRSFMFDTTKYSPLLRAIVLATVAEDSGVSRVAVRDRSLTITYESHIDKESIMQRLQQAVGRVGYVLEFQNQPILRTTILR